MKRKKANNINELASYEAYLNDLFVAAVSNQGSVTKSVNEVLLDIALSYGRAVDDAKEDVKRILNVRGAVYVLLKSASASQYRTAP